MSHVEGKKRWNDICTFGLELVFSIDCPFEEYTYDIGAKEGPATIVCHTRQDLLYAKLRMLFSFSYFLVGNTGHVIGGATKGQGGQLTP